MNNMEFVAAYNEYSVSFDTETKEYVVEKVSFNDNGEMITTPLKCFSNKTEAFHRCMVGDIQ